MTDLLIRTKLRLPFIRPGLVHRLRLQEQVAEGLCGPLTLITAPAGFGKTSLAAACVAACGMPVAWFSLDKDDNQAGRFLTYLVSALQGVDHRIGNEAVHLMAGLQPASPEAVLTSLVNDLDVACGEMVLVLDDYQFISNPEVHADVAFLLEHCPHRFHLLIATRSDPPLPLSRLRARGQMVELRAADLRFTHPEATQFLNDVMGLCLDAGSVAVLEERTEGWVTGLQMAALSMRDHEHAGRFIEGFSGTNRYILDYLLEEVLASQPPEIQRFLLWTSILERLTAPLCDALLATAVRSSPGDEGGAHRGSPLHSQSASVLEYLEREQLFLVALDDERIWFRYHHLFADLLRARLHQSQPNLVSDLHIQASTWLEQKGFIPEAIQQLFAAHEIDRAAVLIERYGPARLAEGDPSVMQMADNLSHERLITRPKIGLYQAWLLIIHSRIDKAVPLLNDMARQLAGADPKSGQQWIQTMIAVALAFLTPPTSTLGFDPLPDYRLLDEIPADELILRNAADYLYGMALARRGELVRAVEVSVNNIRREKSPHGTLAIPTLAPFLTRIYLIQGRIHAAASLCREFLDPIKERGIRFIYTSGSMKIDLGEVLYEWNRLEEAEQHIREGLQANEPWRNIMTDGFGLTALTRVLQAKGDYAGALQVVEKFEARLLEHSQPPEFDEDISTLRVCVQLAGGDLQSASDWADQIQRSEDFQRHQEYYRLTLARIRLAQRRYADVEEILAGMPSLAGAGNRLTREIESKLLEAAAVAGQQRLPEAFGLIESALSLAEPEGYIRVFIDVGEPARELLAAYLRPAATGHRLYAHTLLDAFSASGDAGSPCLQTSGLIEPLSGRELEVLHHLALGKTNQQIARQLIVAAGTIKAHTASIYRKLDVSNRTEAVARARQLGILS
ncbi:MAG: LuxR C-terminal-related transcriptional regulator [Anaerolineaceae bacterium]|nr:LuxR C-terminal-related transcriptional regulator [Anaerolineaceae bacterium]